MSKTFKVVCIDYNGSTFLKQGKIFDACKIMTGKAQTNWNICTLDGNENYGYNKTYFLRLPSEPKTCADMTMEEWLAMCCLRSTGCEAVQYKSSVGSWINCCNTKMPDKREAHSVYRVKPEKSAKDVEIERIEKEMRKLADDLAKIKEK